MLNVTNNNLYEVLQILQNEPILSFDTETTGLRYFHGDKLFSLVIATKEEQYYFNFNELNQNDIFNNVEVLDRNVLQQLKPLFEDTGKLWVAANAKFDMHILSQDGIEIMGDIYDILVIARVLENDLISYSLDSVSKRIGYEKSKEVEEWISKNRAYKKLPVLGKKKEDKQPLFYKVPFHIIFKYACIDAEITLKVFYHQIEKIKEYNASHPTLTSLWEIVLNEVALTKVCYKIEKRGFKIDKELTQKSLDFELKRAEEIKEKFKHLTGRELVDSNKALTDILKNLNITHEKTYNGGISFSKEALKNSNSKEADLILEYRDSVKKASNYYASFLHFADSGGVIHCNIRQSATTTGRFSITDPALQTLNAEESEGDSFGVRNCFIPRKGYFLLSIDYKAFEFRAMLDTAGEKDLALKIEQGLDPHQATADTVGITRKQAKTLNFGLLYGMGVAKLGDALGVDIYEAKRIKSQYFRELPMIKNLIHTAQEVTKQRGYVVNRFGRPYYFKDPKFAYKALNCLIQGGTADAVKFAMVKIDELLKNLNSAILLQIHDEIIFEIHEDEKHIISEIVKIMESSWPQKFHKMSCSLDYSYKSWGDLEPYECETRNSVSEESNGEIKQVT